MRARFLSVVFGQVSWMDMLNQYCVKSTYFQLPNAEPGIFFFFNLCDFSLICNWSLIHYLNASFLSSRQVFFPQGGQFDNGK